VEFEPREPVVVGVLLDRAGGGVVVLPAGGEGAESTRRVAGPGEPGERRERALDAHARDGVVGPQVPIRAPAREHDRADDAGLPEFALQPVGADGSAVRDHPPFGVEPRVDVHDTEVVFQLQHLPDVCVVGL